jgi:mRNA interferase YafQ
MREIEFTSRFKRDYKREKSGRHGKTLDLALTAALNELAADRPLARRYFDHPLTGDWADHRDCHIKPDLVLITASPTQRPWCRSASDRTASLAGSLPASYR